MSARRWIFAALFALPMWLLVVSVPMKGGDATEWDPSPGLESISQSRAVHALPAAQRVPRGRQSSCTCDVAASVVSDPTTMCDPVDVAVRVDPQCEVCETVDVVVVVEDTPHRKWEVDEAQAALTELIRHTTRDERRVRVGVVQYNGQDVQTILRMQEDNVAQARSKMTRIRNEHDPRGLFEQAAQEGVRLMQQARRDRQRDGEDDSSHCEFAIFFAYTKIYMQDKGAEMIRAGQKFHREGIELYVGCPHRHPEECHWAPKVPQSRRFYSEPEDRGKIAGMVRDFMEELDEDRRNEIRLRGLEVVQEVPASLKYVPPPEPEEDMPQVQVTEEGDMTRLSWNWRNVRSLDAFTVTYRLTPTLAGEWPMGGHVELTDMENRTRIDDASAGQVTVIDEICYPTPTPEPSATPTDRPTSTPTDIPTATITLTPTPSVFTAYLPIARRDEVVCVPESVYADAVLVLDMSTSMGRKTAANRTKREAALEAARTFAHQLSFAADRLDRHDQVGVVGFNNTAWTATGLTSDPAVVDKAFDALPDRVAHGTRLDLAFQQGQTVIDAGPRNVDNRPVMIVLTDGLPNRVPTPAPSGSQEDTVLEAAAAAKQAGTRVFTVGLGLEDDVLQRLLRDAASDPSDFYFAPDGEDLAAIYRQIAGRITECP